MSVQEWTGAEPALLKNEGREQRRQRSLEWLKRRAWRRVVITGVLLWHFLALAVWLLPSGAGIVQLGLSSLPVHRYMTFTGLMQDWHMFSPNPDDLDCYVEAKITYQSKRTITWTFPRMAKLGYGPRYQQERWRKILENMTHNPGSGLYVPLARYAARVNNHTPSDPPTTSELIEQYRLVQPPGSRPLNYTAKSLYTLTLRPEDLR